MQVVSRVGVISDARARQPREADEQPLTNARIWACSIVDKQQGVAHAKQEAWHQDRAHDAPSTRQVVSRARSHVYQCSRPAPVSADT